MRPELLGVAGVSAWDFRLTGWPWWVVLPLGAVAVGALWRLQRLEMAALNPKLRLRLLLLRSAVLALLMLFFLEPILTRRSSDRVQPLVAVVVDQSGSMAVRDEAMAVGTKLAEAVGLRLLPEADRPIKADAAAQAASDRSVVEGAKEGSPIRRSLAALAGMSRYERAVKFAAQTAVPLLQPHARVRVFCMDTGLAPMDLSKPAVLPPNRATDFESSLAALARVWAQDYVGGVLLLTDGRQTTGADPAPVIRSLRARGAWVSGVLVGDPGVPPDAVVAEVSGSTEVFLGETVPMTVRYRIAGAAALDWDLILSQNGKELTMRTVRGSGQWEYENFSIPATNSGINLYQARLELAQEQSADALLIPSGSVSLESWSNLNGSQVPDLAGNPAFQKPASVRTSLEQLQYGNRGEQYGARIRGFLLPPQSGEYTFWISSDDGSEFWLSPSEHAEGKVKVAQVSGYVPRGTWDGQASQKSQRIPLKARQPCYFEVLHKQGGGEDHLSVGWQLPDGTIERPIPASRLAAFDEATVGQIASRKKQASILRTNSWKEASVANNSAGFAVAVNQDPIKVLLVDSTPRWESRYLAALFERDRRVSFTRRYHSVMIEDRRAALLPRDQAEWDSYDMVCFGDLDSNELPPEQQKCVANYVSRRGGFLVCLAGPRGMPRAFSLGPIANLLPVRVSLTTGRNGDALPVALTPEGCEHPVMQVLNDPGYNRRLWPLLPPLEWIAEDVVAKPGATALLAAQNAARTPVIALQRYGAGRVFWVGTEETWRWRDRLGERVHQTFWLQAMRWGLAGRLRGQDPRLQVGLDRYTLAPAETAELKARVCGGSGEPLTESPLVQAERLDAGGQPLPASTRQFEMTPIPDAPGLWQLSLSGFEEGTWRITTTHRHLELRNLAERRDLMVRNLNASEEIELGGDFAGLNRLATAGGHQATTMDQAAAALADLSARLKPRTQEHRQTLRLWNSYWSLAAVVALLCAEWVIRKRQGLP